MVNAKSYVRSKRYSPEGDKFYNELENMSIMGLRGMIRRNGQNPDEYGNNRETMIEEIMYLRYGEYND
jgi:hypothetical protein